jgi:hypothetical protein
MTWTIGVPRQPTCTIEGCPEPHNALGLCVKHYHRQYRRRNPRPPRPVQSCTFEGCTEPKRAHDLCHVHLLQRRRGEALRPL